MRLTLDIFQEPETPNQWTSHCVELDIFSAHTLPEVAIEAVAEAVRMTLGYEMKRLGLSCTEAFNAIAKEVAERRLAASSAHGGLNIDKIERACHKWKAQLGKLCADDNERVHLDVNTMLSLVAIARAAKAVRDARRDGLRGDYNQNVLDDLARVLDETGLGGERAMQRRSR